MFDYFTPATGLLGGAMIGASADSLLLIDGDILGASGIMSGVLTHPRKAFSDSSFLWRIVLLTVFMLVSIALPQFASDPRLGDDGTVPIPSQWAYLLAGLLTGFGTRLGNGCTSGHGVCGLGRLSPRSLVAVLTFMATGVTTAMLLSPTASWAEYTAIFRTDHETPINPQLGIALLVLLASGLITLPMRTPITKADKDKVPGAILAGVLFAAGLAISGMVKGSKLYTFLNMSMISVGTWDPTLMTVLGSAIPVSFIAYQFVPNFGVFSNSKARAMAHPLEASSFNVPTNRKIDWNLVLGEAIFGMGWALGLLCPGPAFYHVAVGNPMVVYYWMPMFIAGSAMAQAIKNRQ